ncbi:DNA-binding XRE family transcriptional regulator [Tamaricihabitans halophyticus]|uniref:DNA-binding XRE family transcriptional regulator n=1 Tax=Tamaricihabitans halophyticus TaxID=1262583 RepID=A0A4R2QKD2_9PSEU|nr:helix-turn-helix transcriptional regulator [Tamaricihabitans halophyticus]TCP49204.1 DNA-binding XRE family transcriptional regulator [Tamaricihabitans halophyticus]
MPVNTGISPRARALSAALRTARERSSLTQRDVASKLDVQYTTISHWETGRRAPNTEDVASLLAVLGVRNEERERILELARRASESDWLVAGVRGATQQLAGVMECERTANAITDWSPWLVPGLLQTTDYARAVIGAGITDYGAVEGKLTLRLARRDVLSRVRFTALLGEPALRQVIGGPQVMVEQLRSLTRPAANVTVRIVPIGTGWHPGLAGPFIIYEFPDADTIVHLEHHRSGAFVYNDEDVAEYGQAARVVGEEALSPADSAEFIRSVLAKLEKG